jgi:hypothetical protein
MRRIKDLLISALQDFSYAVRIAMKNPGAPLVLVIGFAIGASANSAIFTVINCRVVATVALSGVGSTGANP